MKRILNWPLILVAVILLADRGTSQAADQAIDRVYWLGIEGWQLCPKKDGVYLVKTPWDKSERFQGDKAAKWTVSAPTIKAGNGKFLASDPAGRKPSVHLVANKGVNTRWAFEFVIRLRPKYVKEDVGECH
jgi:hypothetical protein